MMLRSAAAYSFTAAVFLFYLYPKVRAEALPQIFGQASHLGLHPASFAASQAGVGPSYGLSPSYYNPGSGYYGSYSGPIYGGRAPYPIGGGYPPLGHPNYGHPYSSAAASSSI